MTLLDKLQAHKGGLIHIKSPLYWYGSRSYDNNPGRICLILDAARRVTDAALPPPHSGEQATTRSS